MRAIIILVLFAGVLGCSKYTTPRKVNKKLTDGTWIINEFMEKEKSILLRYKNVSMAFGPAGDLIVTTPTSANVTGKWSVGADRNPAIVYIELPPIDSLHVISDDWVVFKLDKTTCILKRKVGKAGEKDEFDYEKSLDNLTLYKK